MKLEQSAVCGIFCPACTVYIGTKEDPERLVWLAKRFNVSPEEMNCDGCRADRRAIVCRACEFVACATEKGIEFCNACDEYPCEKLVSFQKEKPHRAELWEDNKRIQEQGYETWFDEKSKHYTCRDCDTMNAAYDLACRRCGHAPANDFVAEHGAAVRAHMKKLTSPEE